MKRIAFLMLMLAVTSVHAQKQPKPNLNKILSLYRDGKLAEAKEMADAATTFEKTKDDGKTWYYRGLVYAALDTTSNEQLKALEPQPLQVAIESFAKADSMAGKSEYFIPGPDGVLPVTKSQQIQNLANFYLNQGATLYQEDKLEEALIAFEKTQTVYPQDTTSYFYGGFVANGLEQWDKAITNFEKYIAMGGTSPDAHSLLINIHSGAKEDKEKALQYAQAAKAKFPNNAEFPKVEIGLLIDLNRVEEAKGGLEAAVKSEPDNKIYNFYLGYVNSKMEKWDEARKNFENALRIDPAYFDAQYYLAQIYLIEADKIRNELKSLGINAKDKQRQQELDKQLAVKFKEALPVWEKAEQLKPNDVDVLDRLRTIYYFVGDDKNEKRVEAKLKTLGVEN
jgi:tetratricopeptide (TPR) repeat protein